MDDSPEALREALASGDTGRTNAAIDAVEDMDRETKAERFDELREREQPGVRPTRRCRTSR